MDEKTQNQLEERLAEAKRLKSEALAIVDSANAMASRRFSNDPDSMYVLVTFPAAASQPILDAIRKALDQTVEAIEAEYEALTFNPKPETNCDG